MKTQIILYYHSMGRIGGIETFTYNFIQQFKDEYDIAVVCEHRMGDLQIVKLSKLAPVYFYSKEGNYECDVLISNNLWSVKIPENVRYKKKIQVVHSMRILKTWNIPQGYDVLVPVAMSAFKSFGDDYDKNARVEVIHNITYPEKPQHVLRLISATRLTSEKGGKRMLRLAQEFYAKNIPFIWTVFTNEDSNTTEIISELKKIPGVCIIPAVSDARKYIPGNDYLVQLSDTEGYPYALIEALELNVPVLVTPIPPLEEDINIKNGVNGYVLPFDMQDIDVDMIYSNIPKVSWKSENEHIKKQWKNIIGDLGKPQHNFEGVDLVLVRCVKPYFDVQRNKSEAVGSEYIVNLERFSSLSEKGLVVKV